MDADYFPSWYIYPPESTQPILADAHTYLAISVQNQTEDLFQNELVLNNN